MREDAELSDTMDVWIVEPGKSGFDLTVYDNPEDAGVCAGEVADRLWDQAEPGQIVSAVTIRHAKMLVSEFEDLETDA
jgi:hypothetical protein